MANRVFREPLQKVNEKYILLDIRVKSIRNSIDIKVNNEKAKFVELASKLDALSPLKTLTRGYSIITKDNKVVKSVNSIKNGDEIQVKFIDGKAKAKIM